MNLNNESAGVEDQEMKINMEQLKKITINTNNS